jgi:retron-type reverse transcriptase
VSQFAYGDGKNPSPNQDKKYKKFNNMQEHYKPQVNKFNIYNREGPRQIPKTRDRFINQAFSQLLAPSIKEKAPERFAHDKLNTNDIVGTNPDVYRKYKGIEGRNAMDMSDIERSGPN